MKFSEDKKIIILISFAVGALVGGIMIWEFASVKFQKELTEQREGLVAMALPYLPQGPKETTGLNGNIESADELKIILRTDPVHANPFEKRGPEIRTALLTDATKIYRRSPKDPAVLRKEEQDFFVMSPEEREEKRPFPPDPFVNEEVSPAEFFIGQRIAVFADEDIKYKEEFTVSSIEFNQD